MRRKQLELAERRRAVLAAAERLFAEAGFEGTRISRIAREVGLSVGSLYNLFQNKAELFSAVLLNAIDERQEQFERLAALPPREALKQFLQGMIDAFRRHQLLFRMMVETMAEPHAISKSLVHNFMARREERLRLLAGIIQRGVRSGEFRVREEPMRVASALAGSMIGLFHHMLRAEGRISPELSADMVMGFLLHGIARPGK